ncbi:reverse transcriptase domain-containing protein, partial [Tanacetum coccineum]
MEPIEFEIQEMARRAGKAWALKKMWQRCSSVGMIVSRLICSNSAASMDISTVWIMKRFIEDVITKTIEYCLFDVVVEFHSIICKTILDELKRFSTELLAVVFSFDKFRQYLVLSKIVVYTDHSALKYLFSKEDAKPRLIRFENPNLGTLAEEEITDEFPDEHLMILKAELNKDEP